jgi:multidrug resistance efflux pump
VTDEVVRKQIMDEARSNVEFGRAIQRREQRVEIPDALTRYREEAEAAQAAREDETTRRIAEARLTQIEREIRAALVEADVDGRIAVLEEAVGQAMAKFVSQQLRPLVKRLDALEAKRRRK